jgi:hypothetical protein
VSVAILLNYVDRWRRVKLYPKVYFRANPEVTKIRRLENTNPLEMLK